jgi:hypothetical protein
MSVVDPISAAQDDAAHLCLGTLVWWDSRMGVDKAIGEIQLR